MSKTKETKIRLPLLYDLLRHHTDEDNPLATEDIVAMLEKKGITITSRSIIEDVKLLNEFGYDIKSFKKKHLYFYVVDRPFDVSEIKVLMDAVQAASFIPDSQTERFVAKIADLAGCHRADVLKQNIVCFDTHKRSNKYVFYSIDTLVTAIGQKKKASFLYYDLDVDKNKAYRKDGARYVVNPLALIFTNDKYYLVCYSDKYRDLSTYRIDRMEKVEIESADITSVPEYENFNIHAYRQQAFSMFHGELKDVTLLVDNSCLDAILDRFGEQVPLCRVDDNTFRVSVKVQVSPAFFAWCLTSCQKIKITAPADVIAQYGEYVKTAVPDNRE
jgi:predicted DNA-binding transcriptional regulator YafY